MQKRPPVIEPPRPDPRLMQVRYWHPRPLDDVARAIEIIAEVSGSSPTVVMARLKKEHEDLGVNVREAMLRHRVPAYQFSELMREFYATTDAFLYETYCWNRYPLKQAMRNWIVAFLQRNFSRPARVLSFGDGLGFDSAGLALAGHDVTYFDVGNLSQAFSDRIFSDNQVQVARCHCIDDLHPESFDTVVCLDVLEHVPQPQHLVQQLSRSLKPGGFFIAHAPFWLLDKAVCTHLRDNLQFSGDWRRLYGPSGLRIVDGTFMWNPLALQMAGALKLASASVWTRTKVAFGGFLLRGSHWCRLPLTWICRSLIRREGRVLLQNTAFPTLEDSEGKQRNDHVN